MTDEVRVNHPVDEHPPVGDGNVLAPVLAPVDGQDGRTAAPPVTPSVAVATQRRLMWWRFRKHRLALVAGIVLILFYSVVIFADFLAYADPYATDAQRSLRPPQAIHWDGAFHPYVHPLTGSRDPVTFQRIYRADTSQKVHVGFFVHGYKYKLFGVFQTDVHLLGVEGSNGALAVLGTDPLGRDVYSRLLLATRTSLTIGLVGVGLSLVLGIALGGISGYFVGWVDTWIQRVIEVINSIPTIPLWMGIAAAIPRNWSVTQVFFAFSIIISFIAWTDLARVVRGRILQIRREEFIVAAELAGSRPRRIIFVHMVPLFASHIIAATTLALPAMIIFETALSFLGLGLRPPAISWGVMLQQAQNVETIVLSPWLMVPVIPVTLAILAFNFLGDGLRDAADPYS
jgi:peptide/nickel transport system permease protein